jgi:hypothetical protein
MSSLEDAVRSIIMLTVRAVNLMRALILSNLRKNFYDRMKFLIQGDDDTFWRVDQVIRWLALEKLVDKSVPLVANGNCSLSLEQVKTEGSGVWHIQGCNEIRENGWYQPLMLSKAAIERISTDTAKYEATETCKCNAFVVSQDVGLPVFFWLYPLEHIERPGNLHQWKPQRYISL